MLTDDSGRSTTPQQGFLIFQPHLRNIGALAMRRTDGYGASTVARIWSEK